MVMDIKIDKSFDLITEYQYEAGEWHEIRQYYWVPAYRREPVSFAGCPGCGRRLNITEAAKHLCYGGSNGVPRLAVKKPRIRSVAR